MPTDVPHSRGGLVSSDVGGISAISRSQATTACASIARNLLCGREGPMQVQVLPANERWNGVVVPRWPMLGCGDDEVAS
jgi:hypothetical protein